MLSLKRKMDCFVVYALFFAIFKPYFLPPIAQKIIKLVIIVIIMLYLIAKNRVSIKKNEVVLYGMVIIASSFFAYKDNIISFIDFLYAIYYAICLECVFLIIKYFCEKGRSRELLLYLQDICGVYAVLSLISMFTPLYIDSSGLKTYLFGNKFFSSYYFLMYIAIFYSLHNNKIKKYWGWKLIYIMIIFLSIVFSVYTKCSTSIVASVVYLLLLYIPSKVRKILMNPIFAVCAVAFSASFPVLMEKIMNNELVQFIVVNILGESTHLNYRNIIYSNHIFSLISNRLFWGYGYSNTAMLDRTGQAFSNAQNALMEIAINYGIIGAGGLVLLIFYCFRKSVRNDRCEGIVFFIYILILNGLIEITYEWFFLWALFLFRWIDIEKKNKFKT